MNPRRIGSSMSPSEQRHKYDRAIAPIWHIIQCGNHPTRWQSVAEPPTSANRRISVDLRPAQVKAGVALQQAGPSESDDKCQSAVAHGGEAHSRAKRTRCCNLHRSMENTYRWPPSPAAVSRLSNSRVNSGVGPSNSISILSARI